MSLPINVGDLTQLWNARWPLTPPVAHKLRVAYPERWVRFHSRPEAQRYPEDENEYAVVLARYNTVLDELFGGRDLLIVRPVLLWDTPAFQEEPKPNGDLWQTVEYDDDGPGPATFAQLFVHRFLWEKGILDSLLREIADFRQAGVLITDFEMRRISAPYDGGADVLLATTEERDTLRRNHADWLSPLPSGL